MATHTTPKNEVCTYSYDLRDRQTLADWSSSTPDTARTYWANGLLKSIDNGVSKSDFTYNARHELTSETQTLASRPARTAGYTYDADGLRSGLSGSVGVSPTSYSWTARAQLASLSADGPPPLATYTYDKGGRNTSLTHENGITEAKTYDAANQLLANTHLKSGTPVSGHGYTLDSTGRRTAETFADGITSARSYGYDLANQVTTATYDTTQTDTYNYDPAGNRSTASFSRSVGVPPTSGTTTYTTNTANQYTTITGLASITYDANGNLTYENGVSYTWDSENRLLSVSDGVKRIDHTYDGQARRVTSKVLNLATSTLESETQFIYDGWNVVAEYQGGTSGSPALTKTRTWGMDLSSSLQGAGGVGGLIMVEEINGTTTTAYHFHYDGNGNVTEITDLNGNNAASYRYDAFGNTLVATGIYAADNRYRFSTKPLNSEITAAPLYYYGYRYYDPITGRWPSRDPIQERGGINLYGFVGNDAVSKWDILGNKIRVITNPTGCIVTLELLINIRAQANSGVTIQDLDNVRPRIENSINNRWNEKDWKFDCCSLKVVAIVFTGNSGGDNVIDIVNDKYRSNVKTGWFPWSSDSGTWWTGADDWVYAHEAGHLMGLPDQYKDQPDGKSKPNKRHEGEMMGEYNGSVSQYEIDELIKKNKVKCPCAKK